MGGLFSLQAHTPKTANKASRTYPTYWIAFLSKDLILSESELWNRVYKFRLSCSLNQCWISYPSPQSNNLFAAGSPTGTKHQAPGNPGYGRVQEVRAWTHTPDLPSPKELVFEFSYNYCRPLTKLREGNVFTGVCLSIKASIMSLHVWFHVPSRGCLVWEGLVPGVGAICYWPCVISDLPLAPPVLTSSGIHWSGWYTS